MEDQKSKSNQDNSKKKKQGQAFLPYRDIS